MVKIFINISGSDLTPNPTHTAKKKTRKKPKTWSSHHDGKNRNLILDIKNQIQYLKSIQTTFNKTNPITTKCIDDQNFPDQQHNIDFDTFYVRNNARIIRNNQRIQNNNEPDQQHNIDIDTFYVLLSLLVFTIAIILF